MDQQKIGKFLKDLRKEKNLTQEQFAEVMSVSNRSVSRWETGSNLPDLDILIQIADYSNHLQKEFTKKNALVFHRRNNFARTVFLFTVDRDTDYIQ